MNYADRNIFEDTLNKIPGKGDEWRKTDWKKYRACPFWKTTTAERRNAAEEKKLSTGYNSAKFPIKEDDQEGTSNEV